MVTYQGIAALCRTLELNLLGVASDERGMDPQALREACRRHKPRVVFIVSSIQNPTAITLDEERRQQLAEVLDEAASW